MAAPTTPANWAVLPGGNAANGAGFDPTVPSPGTDYSQQNAAQVTFTDLVIGGTTTQLTSAAFPFGSLYPGNYVHVTGGTGFTVGWYRVHSVSGVTATMDRAVGTGGSTGGGGKLGGAFAKPDDINSPNPTGGVIYCVGTTFTIGATGIAVTAGGDDNKPLSFIGNGTTRGDGTPAIFTCNASDPTTAMDFQSSYTLVRGIKLNGASIASDGIRLSQTFSSMANCWGLNCRSNNIRLMNSNQTAFRCRTSGLVAGTTGSGGFFVSSGCRLLWCESDNNTGNGYASSNQYYEATHCAAYNNTKSGFYTFGTGGVFMTNCVSDHNTLDGVRWDATNSLNGSTVVNCQFSNNAGYGLRSLTTDYSVAANAQVGLQRFWNNSFYNNTLGNRFQMPAGTGDILCSVDPATSVDQFSPNALATGGALVRGTGISQLGTLDDPRPTTSYLNVGVAQHQGYSPSTAPSGLTVVLVGTTGATLTWVDNSSDEAYFLVERAAGAGSYSIIGAAVANATTYSDTGLAASTTYTYRVSAISTLGGQSGTVTASITTPSASGTITPPTFINVLFPTGIAEGASGGLQFSTTISVQGNGLEARVPLYDLGRYRWNAGPGIKSPTDMALVTAFFAARRGKAYGFRWKDWDDYQATQQVLDLDGTPTAQLIKHYTSGGVDYERLIFAPVTGTVSFRRASVTYAAWSLSYSTGVVTWTAIISKAITAITKAASAVVTVGAAHGFVVGDVVYFTGVLGMTEINGLTGSVTAIAATTITVNIASTGFTTWTSGGTAAKYPQPADVVDWTGEFDVPTRFDTDEMVMVQDSVGYRTCNSLPVIELTGE